MQQWSAGSAKIRVNVSGNKKFYEIAGDNTSMYMGLVHVPKFKIQPLYNGPRRRRENVTLFSESVNIIIRDAYKRLIVFEKKRFTILKA